MKRIKLVASSLLIMTLPFSAAVGCDDDEATGPNGTSSGLEFEYDGARSGSYQSEGMPTIAASGLPDVGSWAIARADSLGGLVIAGFEPTGQTQGDLFILQLHPLGTGEFTPCGVSGGEGCHGRFIVGVDTEDLSAVEAWYEISEGSVTLTEAGPDRVVGSFSATFTEFGGTATLTVTDGVIDVPFSQDPSLANGLRCLIENLQAGTNEPC